MLSETEQAEYNSLLNLSGGMMGYVNIPKIGVTLPIYHGTGETVLQKGAGHLEGSSLPVGGENTHAVLSSHRGLVTCTPYGVNTHRLLVRGHRVETTEELIVPGDAFQLESSVVAPLVAVPVLIVILAVLLVATRKRKQ